MQTRAPEPRLVAGEIEEQRLVARRHLAQEERVENLRRLDHPDERLALVRGQGGDVGAQVDRREPRRHRLQLRQVWNTGIGGARAKADGNRCRED